MTPCQRCQQPTVNTTGLCDQCAVQTRLMLKMFPAITAVCRKHHPLPKMKDGKYPEPVGNWNETIPCPACDGKLTVAFDAKTKLTAANCSNPECYREG